MMQRLQKVKVPAVYFSYSYFILKLQQISLIYKKQAMQQATFYATEIIPGKLSTVKRTQGNLSEEQNRIKQ